MVILFPEETSEVTLMYFPSIREDFTEQSASCVGSDKRNVLLHINFSRKSHTEKVFSATTRSVPIAFTETDLPFEAMHSPKGQDFSLQ